MFDFTLTIKNNTSSNFNIDLLNPADRNASLNAPLTYSWDLSIGPILSTQFSLQAKLVGAASFTTYTRTMAGTGFNDVLVAANSLGMGLFALNGSILFTPNKLYEFGNVVIGTPSSVQWSGAGVNYFVRETLTSHLIDFAFDAGGNAITVTYLNLPAFVTVVNTAVPTLSNGGSANIANLTLKPLIADSGNYSFTMRATAGGVTVDKVYSITIDVTNHPTFTSRPNQNITLSISGGIQGLGNLSSTLAISPAVIPLAYPLGKINSVSIGTGPGALNPQATPVNSPASTGVTVLLIQVTDTPGQQTDSQAWIVNLI